MDWDPQRMMTNLSFLEEKIQQLREIVRSLAGDNGNLPAGDAAAAAVRQQLVNADLTCIIIQLITTAGSLLPSMPTGLLSANPAVRAPAPAPEMIPASTEYDELVNGWNASAVDEDDQLIMDCLTGDDGVDGDGEEKEEILAPGSYVVLQLEKEEILAPHTHFCAICGKGFKRDANLRMHMRGHGDEYKSPGALARSPPVPASAGASEAPAPATRYSCPFAGCKRNREHRQFRPLKNILCVKNHYKRSHCDKSFTCSRCGAKKFSVLADLRTHEKHCGRQRWLCSCGTTFSRKDKLFGHVALFQGHTPVLPSDALFSVEGSSSSAMDIKDVAHISGNGDQYQYCGFGGMDDELLDVHGGATENLSFLQTGRRRCGDE